MGHLLALLLTSGLLVGDVGTEPELPRALSDGTTHRELEQFVAAAIPDWEMPNDADAWMASVEKVRQRFLRDVVYRGVPEAWMDRPYHVEWGETIEREGYSIRKFIYEPVPTLWVGGLLYVPISYDSPLAQEGRVPAVLNPNGHVGKEGMSVAYKQIRCINLAKRGMIAMNLEWIGMGQLSDEGYRHEHLAYLDLAGTSGLSVFYLSLKHALDVLIDHPHVDAERVAVSGLSGGGWQTIMLGALDTRVKAVVPNAGYIGLHKRVYHVADIGDREQGATDLGMCGDYVHLTALLAPRPALLIYNAKDNCCFQADRAKSSVYDPIVPLYEMMGHAEKFSLHVNDDPGTHNYERDNRQAFYRFINRHFVPESAWVDEELPVEDEVDSQDGLRVTYPEENGDFFTLAQSLYQTLPKANAPASSPAEKFELWQKSKRRELEEVLRLKRLPDQKKQRSLLTTKTLAVGKGSVTLGELCVGKVWSIPLVMSQRRTSEPKVIVLVLDDRGWQKAYPKSEASLPEGELRVGCDLLLMGECQPVAGRGDSWAMMLETVGYRTLGIQVWQLQGVLKRLRREHPDLPVQVQARGTMASTVALLTYALGDKAMDQLELYGMVESFQDLLVREISYRESPSLFCFGLLACADVAELVQLAPAGAIHLHAEELP